MRSEATSIKNAIKSYMMIDKIENLSTLIYSSG